MIDQQRVARLRVLEQQRRPAGLDDAVVDLCDLEVRVDLCPDPNELALALERAIQAQVGRGVTGSVYEFHRVGNELVDRHLRSVRRRSTELVAAKLSAQPIEHFVAPIDFNGNERKLPAASAIARVRREAWRLSRMSDH